MGTMLTPWTNSDDLPSPLTSPFKIRLYDERVRGFQLKVAQQMLSGDPGTGTPLIPWAGFASLSVVFSYFESYEQHRSGRSTTKGGSGKAFRAGLREVFPHLVGLADKHLAALWEKLRCGLYHCGNCKRGVVIGPEQPALEYNAGDDTWYVNPEKVVTAIGEHHTRYVATLVPSSPALVNFETVFDEFWS